MEGHDKDFSAIPLCSVLAGHGCQCKWEEFVPGDGLSVSLNHSDAYKYHPPEVKQWWGMEEEECAGLQTLFFFWGCAVKTLIFSLSRRCTIIHAVGTSRLFLSHPDCTVWVKSLQQEPDGEATSHRGVRNGRRQGQSRQVRGVDGTQGLFAFHSARQNQVHKC